MRGHRSVVNAGGHAFAAFGVHQAPVQQQNAHSPVPHTVTAQAEKGQKVNDACVNWWPLVSGKGARLRARVREGGGIGEPKPGAREFRLNRWRREKRVDFAGNFSKTGGNNNCFLILDRFTTKMGHVPLLSGPCRLLKF